jgi:hypothetical protein
LQKTELALSNNAPAESSSMRLQQLGEELAGQLIATLAESRSLNKPAMHKRDRALKVAVDFIFESDRPVTSVRELLDSQCQRTHAGICIS